MNASLAVRKAHPSDASTVLELLDGCCLWLRSTGKGRNGGMNQWPERFDPCEISDKIDSGEFYLADYEGLPAGTFCFTAHPDWYGRLCQDQQIREAVAARMEISESELLRIAVQSELAEPAMYWHSFAVSRHLTGQGIGRALLNWGEEATRQRQFRMLRLDCHYLNVRLRQYYIDAGFESLHYLGEQLFGGIFQKRV